MIVSGAGTSAVNGTHVESGQISGKPFYIYDNCGIMWTGTAWTILHSDGDPYYYYSYDDVATPDLCTTWEVHEGELPVPTVTADGGSPVGIPKHFLHYARLRSN